MWHRQRRLAAPAFTLPSLDAYSETMVSLTEAMLRKWQPGEVIDIDRALMSLTLAIAVRTLFSTIQ